MDDAQKRALMEKPNNTLSFPQGAAWLLERLRSYDYQIDEGNLCHSFSWIGLTAILRKDVQQLYHRLGVILSIDKENFSQQMDAAKQKIMQLIISTRQQIQHSVAHEFNLPDNINIREFEKSLDARQKQQFYHLVHEEINRRKAAAENQQAHALVDVLSLLESLELYQHARAYSQLIIKPKMEVNAGFRTPLHVPSSLQQEGGLIQVKLFSGIYSHHELQTYFRSLRSILSCYQDFELPLAFTLNNSDHTITVGFLNQHWIVIDSNELDFSPIENDADVAKKVFSALAYPHADNILLSTKIYATKKNAPLIEECINNWQNHPEYILIHR